MDKMIFNSSFLKLHLKSETIATVRKVETKRKSGSLKGGLPPHVDTSMQASTLFKLCVRAY